MAPIGSESRFLSRGFRFFCTYKYLGGMYWGGELSFLGDSFGGVGQISLGLVFAGAGGGAEKS